MKSNDKAILKRKTWRDAKNGKRRVGENRVESSNCVRLGDGLVGKSNEGANGIPIRRSFIITASWVCASGRVDGASFFLKTVN